MSALLDEFAPAGFRGIRNHVISVRRGQCDAPYQPNGAWKFVHTAHFCPAKPTRKPASSARKSANLRPDIVIDMICFTNRARDIWSRPYVGECDISCIPERSGCTALAWKLPPPKRSRGAPFGEHEIQRRKSRLCPSRLRARSHFQRLSSIRVISSDPGESRKPRRTLQPTRLHHAGEGRGAAALPNFGLETVHHVHATTSPRCSCTQSRTGAHPSGRAFHAVSPACCGHASRLCRSNGDVVRPRGEVAYQPWMEWKDGQNELEAAQTYDHIAHSPNCSIAKAERLLGYRPRYQSIEAVCKSVNWLIERGIVQVQREAV